MLLCYMCVCNAVKFYATGMKNRIQSASQNPWCVTAFIYKNALHLIKTHRNVFFFYSDISLFIFIYSIHHHHHHRTATTHTKFIFSRYTAHILTARTYAECVSLFYVVDYCGYILI